jgi:hypothetical protein
LYYLLHIPEEKQVAIGKRPGVKRSNSRYTNEA